MTGKQVRPSSIRLTPAADELVSNWVQITGWSITACINHAILVARSIHMAQPSVQAALQKDFNLAAKVKAIEVEAAEKLRKAKAESRAAK
jgi:hypothetical protein